MRSSTKRNHATLEDFFLAAETIGFSSIELNHHIDSAMLAGIDLSRYRFSSIHEPCPADITPEQLKERDWLISSTDETCRREGVAAILRSIDLAHQLNAPIVVIHPGQALADPRPEAHLRALYIAGNRTTGEYEGLVHQMEAARREFAAPHLKAVKKSILELLEAATRLGIRLGLENRYHYYEFPLPDELEILLMLAGPEDLGMIYDVGHAEVLDRLGFIPHFEWLEQFSRRIIGVHLHDVIALTDHRIPGMGEVNFKNIAPYLPANAFRTCEFHNIYTAQDVQAGVTYLAGQDCIQAVG
jgi:sugar phosphate isomerase/epimerase